MLTKQTIVRIINTRTNVWEAFMSKVIISNEYKALQYDINISRKNKSKKRTLRILILMLVTICLLLGVFALFSSDTFGSEEMQEPKKIVIQDGDCLWNIAGQYSSGKDIRMVLYDIKKHNNIGNENIYPGMIIEIPAKYLV